MLEQEPERLVDLMRSDHMVIVEDQPCLFRRWLARQVVDQRRDQALERGRRRRAEQRRHPFGDPGAGPGQRGHRVPPEPGRVIVPRIQRQPGGRLLAAPGPVGQQHRLATPGRGAHQGQPARGALIQLCRQPRP